MYHIVHLYTKLFYKLFFKFTINFYEKLAHVGDECPWKLIKIIYNYEIYKLEYEHLMNHFEKHFGLYVIIKLNFKTLILKLKYHVEQIG